jgi:hypothetical protein
MRYITLSGGKTVHLVEKEKGGAFGNRPHAYCGRYHASYSGDKMHDNLPAGRLCSQCRNGYLKKHSEEDLFLEMM